METTHHLMGTFTHSPESVTQVAGTYRIHEVMVENSEKKLVETPLTVKVIQWKDYIAVEVFDETKSENYQLEYPMAGAPIWDKKQQAAKHTRPHGAGFLVDVHRIPKDFTADEVLTTRIQWVKDESGRIDETYVGFNAEGNLVESYGFQRVLFPMVEN